MSVLTKTNTRIYIPGTVGDPGSPGSPPTPEHTVWESVQVCETLPGACVDLRYGYWETFAGGWVTLRPGEVAPPGSYTAAGWYCYEYDHEGGGEICHTEQVSTVIPASPGVPAIPPTPAAPNQVITDNNVGWTGSAQSVDQLTGNGYVSCSVSPSVVGVFFGIGTDQNAAYETITHAFYFSHGRYDIYENGALAQTGGSYTESTVFAIRRLGEVITFFVL